MVSGKGRIKSRGNNFGNEFYILAGANTAISGFITFLSPLFMPLLFTLAGISTRYPLHKRTPKQYIKEGWTYLASVMDLCSRKIVGYAYGTSMTAELAHQPALWEL